MGKVRRGKIHDRCQELTLHSKLYNELTRAVRAWNRFSRYRNACLNPPTRLFSADSISGVFLSRMRLSTVDRSERLARDLQRNLVSKQRNKIKVAHRVVIEAPSWRLQLIPSLKRAGRSFPNQTRSFRPLNN